MKGEVRIVYGKFWELGGGFDVYFVCKISFFIIFYFEIKMKVEGWY